MPCVTLAKGKSLAVGEISKYVSVMQIRSVKQNRNSRKFKAMPPFIIHYRFFQRRLKIWLNLRLTLLPMASRDIRCIHPPERPVRRPEDRVASQLHLPRDTRRPEQGILRRAAPHRPRGTRRPCSSSRRLSTSRRWPQLPPGPRPPWGTALQDWSTSLKSIRYSHPASAKICS